MFRGILVLRIVVALLVIGLLVAGGFGIYHLGWQQGYAAGQLAVGGERVVRMMHPGWVYPGRFFGTGPIFGGLGLLFLIGIVVLLVVAVVAIFRPRTWPTGSGPWGKYGHMPGEEKAAEQPPVDSGEKTA